MDKQEQKTLSSQVRSGSGGKEVGVIELNPRIFSAPKRHSLVHATVRWQRAKRRSGTHQALTRSMMKGGGKKPFKQKGTGQARAGSIISPLWVGGASIHGPLPRDYSYSLQKRTRVQAISVVLSDKFRRNKLIVVDSLAVKSSKTSDAVKMLNNLGLPAGRGALLVTETDASKQDPKSLNAFRNIPKLSVLSVSGVNVYDLLRHEYLVISRDAVEALQTRLLESEARLKREAKQTSINKQKEKTAKKRSSEKVGDDLSAKKPSKAAKGKRSKDVSV